jgi:hypothetical protein
MRPQFFQPPLVGARLDPNAENPPAILASRASAPREISRPARRRVRAQRAIRDFSILRFFAVAGAATVLLTLFVLTALKLAGAGLFAAGAQSSIALACLFCGLGFSSWLFEDHEIRC